jgi:hypothetical protein
MTLDEFLIDKRIVDRNIKNGKVDGAQYRAALAALPDLSYRLWRRPEVEPAVAAPAESDAARTNASRQEPNSVPQFQPTPLG